MKAPVSKTGIPFQGIAGSNPALSAIFSKLRVLSRKSALPVSPTANCPAQRADLRVFRRNRTESNLVPPYLNRPISINQPDHPETHQMSRLRRPVAPPRSAACQTVMEKPLKSPPDETKSQKRVLSVIKTISGAISTGALGGVDWYHRYALRIRAGERAVRRTTKIRFAPETSRQVSARQGNQCMYCGITLNRNNRQIDHIYPVEFGGPNEDRNLQALCGPCNARKGVQTDSDFRERYREVLGGVSVGRPPSTRIGQSRFREITRTTQQGDTTRGLRRAVFRTPKQKIMAGSTAAGAVSGLIWFFGMPLIFGGHPVVSNLALFGGLAVFALTWIGSMWRAKGTGVLEQQ